MLIPSLCLGSEDLGRVPMKDDLMGSLNLNDESVSLYKSQSFSGGPGRGSFKDVGVGITTGWVGLCV